MAFTHTELRKAHLARISTYTSLRPRSSLSFGNQVSHELETVATALDRKEN